jgi:hypothetical protein
VEWLVFWGCCFVKILDRLIPGAGFLSFSGMDFIKRNGMLVWWEWFLVLKGFIDDRMSYIDGKDE